MLNLLYIHLKTKEKQGKNEEFCGENPCFLEKWMGFLKGRGFEKAVVFEKDGVFWKDGVFEDLGF